MCFTLAMVKNPRIWKRAQAEIDAVLGTDRLPEYEDRPSLPYVGAIVRETLRWKPVAPLGAFSGTCVLDVYSNIPEGVPHAVISDDVYKGYHIPSGMFWTCTQYTCSDTRSTGATVIPNHWYAVDPSLTVTGGILTTLFYRAMSRDETRYPNPEVFMPERFLDSEGMLNGDDPAHFAFGFGRRICPGEPQYFPMRTREIHALSLARSIHCGCLCLGWHCDDAGHAGFQCRQRRERQ